jgi:hypothetical protein
MLKSLRAVFVRGITLLLLSSLTPARPRLSPINMCFVFFGLIPSGFVAGSRVATSDRFFCYSET